VVALRWCAGSGDAKQVPAWHIAPGSINEVAAKARVPWSGIPQRNRANADVMFYGIVMQMF
jgi:hypothetical protein